MSLGLHNLTPNEGSKKNKKNRLGRGNSSGHGTYSTRGLKGQKSRSGGSSGLKRRGLKMIIQRMPKFKGMKSTKTPRQAINLSVLDKFFEEGDTVDKKALISKKLLSTLRTPFKVLNKGEITKKLNLNVFEISKTARESIEKVGGTVTIIEKIDPMRKKIAIKK